MFSAMSRAIASVICQNIREYMVHVKLISDQSKRKQIEAFESISIDIVFILNS